MKTIGLLGGMSWESSAEYYHLNVLVPDAPDREIIHRVIYEELCLSQILPTSRVAYQAVIGGRHGACGALRE